MGTRSYIGFENKEGVVEASYCHWDGYVEGVGMELVKGYTSYERVKELVGKGGMSFVHTDINEINYYGDQPSEKYRNYQEYSDEMLSSSMFDIEYFYLFRKGEWYVVRKVEGSRKFESVKKLLGIDTQSKKGSEDSTFVKLLDIAVDFIDELNNIKFSSIEKDIVLFDTVAKKNVKKIQELNKYKPINQKGNPNNKKRMANLDSIYIGDTEGKEALLIEFKLNTEGKIVGVEFISYDKGRIDGHYYTVLGDREDYRLKRLPNYYKDRIYKISGNIMK